MNSKSSTLVKVLVAVTVVIVPLVAAAWLIPTGFPMMLRQILLCAWGVGATLVAERLLFSPTYRQAVATVGFVPARMRTVLVSLLVSLPMWLFLPLFARFNGIAVQLQPGWWA